MSALNQSLFVAFYTSIFDKTIFANNGGVFSGNINTDGHVGRPSAQVVARNYLRPDLHSIVSLENHYAGKEQSIVGYSLLDNGNWNENWSIFSSFVNADNTATNFNAVFGVHMVGVNGGVGHDNIPFMMWDNNSIYANAGSIDIAKEWTLPPADAFVIGGDYGLVLGAQFAAGTFVKTSGFSFENRIGNGWGRFANNSSNIGVEVGYSGGGSTGFLYAYDRANSVFKPIALGAGTSGKVRIEGQAEYSAAPVYANSLPSNTIYKDTAANITARGDLFLAIKA